MIRVKHIGIALLAGVALTLLPVSLPGASLGLMHEPMLVFERTFEWLIPLNAGKRVVTLFAANVATWAVLVVMVELCWCRVKGPRAAARN